MSRHESLPHMHARVAQCRRLAEMVNDPQTIEALNRMAEDIATDIERMKSSNQQ